MTTGRLNDTPGHLRRAALLRDGAGLTDGELLEQYRARGDEAALAALVRRHGAMVYAVCRRVLRDAHDAEDATQATFLVLVKKAASLARPERVANWLYGAAYRAAQEARAARRRSPGRPVERLPELAAVDPAPEWRDLRPLLDGELRRLPEKYREAVVLCDLEGRTRREAARRLGVPEGTLSGRLTAARRMLAGRLTRRGVTLSAVALAAALADARADAPAGSLVEAAASLAAGKGAAATVPPTVAALAEGVMRTMFLDKLKTLAVVLVALVLAVGGAGAAWQRAGATDWFAPPPDGHPAGEKEAPPNDPAAPRGHVPNNFDAADSEKPPEIPVRLLTVPRKLLPSPADEGAPHGRNETKALRTAEEAEKLLGKKAAEELAKQADFRKEDVVVVGWRGSENARLEVRVVGAGKEATVEFYVKEPPPNGQRETLVGQLGLNFYAVPKGTAVSFFKEKVAPKGLPDPAERGVPSGEPSNPDGDPKEPAIPPPGSGCDVK